MNYKITLLPGDGIGTEVTGAAVEVLKFAAENYGITLELNEQLMGGCSYEAHGVPITDETIDICKQSNAVFLGAVGGPKWENLAHHLKPEAALLKLRKSLGLYTNIRPAKVYSAFLDASSLKNNILAGTDFIVLRELTGGIYFGEPRGMDDEKGWNTMIYTRPEIERIARQAFEIAKNREKRVTSVDKANVLEVSQYWRNVVHKVARDYPDITLSDMYVDNAAMQIVRNPKQFDVILTGNLFGDIISDIAGMITGSLGMLPSASLGTDHSLYEPVHGSAPDIAGQNKANPIAAIASVAMMFEYTFNMHHVARIIESSIEKTLRDGFRTVDIATEGGNVVSTNVITEQILKNCKVMFNKEADVQVG
jgi:3-isopropylmalate dehydrogenase